MTNPKNDITTLFDLEGNIEQIIDYGPEFLEDCVLLQLPFESVNPFIDQLLEYAGIEERDIEKDVEVLRYFSRYMLVFTSDNDIKHYPLLFTVNSALNYKELISDLERKKILRNIEMAYAETLLDFDISWIVDFDRVGKRWERQLTEWRSKANLSPGTNSLADKICEHFYDLNSEYNVELLTSTKELLSVFKTKPLPLTEIPKTYPLTRAAFGVEFAKIHRALVDSGKYQGTLGILFQMRSLTEMTIDPNAFGYKLALAEGYWDRLLLNQEHYMERIITDDDGAAFLRTYGHRPNLPLAKVVGNALLENKVRFATIDELKERARTNILNTESGEESGDINKEISQGRHRFKVVAKQRIAGESVNVSNVEGGLALAVVLNDTHVGFGDLLAGIATVDLCWHIVSSAEIIFEPTLDKTFLVMHYPLKDYGYRADNLKVASMDLLRQFNIDAGMDFDTALQITQAAEKEETCDAMLVGGVAETLSLFIDLDTIKIPGIDVRFTTETHHYTIT